LAARQQLLANMQGPAAQQVKANSVFTVRFDFGSTRVAIPPDVTAAPTRRHTPGGDHPPHTAAVFRGPHEPPEFVTGG
ncbi:MAG: hypothetical protein ACOVT5_14240, partial [Armatimonadaceae bacterium]